MKNIILNNGVEMPILGFGVYQVPDADQCEPWVYKSGESMTRLPHRLSFAGIYKEG